MGAADDINTLRRRLEGALDRVAALVAVDQSYLPVYERLEAELNLMSQKEGALGRAKARAARHKAMR